LKYWNASEAVENDDVAEDTLFIALSLAEWFGSGHHEPTPRIVSIGASDDDGDEWNHELMIELEPGVLLPIEHGCMEDLQNGELGHDYNDPTNVIEHVVGAVIHCQSRIGEVRKVLHDARLRARKLLGRWNADGLPVRLIDVRLAPDDHWRGSDAPATTVLVEGFDHHLSPKMVEIEVLHPDALEKELERHRRDFERSYAERTRFMSLGASGSIDQLALNALTIHGGLQNHLDLLTKEWRFWLADETAIVTEEGHVHAGSGNPDLQVQWLCDRMNIRSTFMPAERLNAAVGHPVSDLYRHPLLSAEMVVVEAECIFEDGLPILSIKYTQNPKLFCSGSGRVWDFPEEDAGRVVTGGTVVPFARRPAA
jgi:hypothetical protein